MGVPKLGLKFQKARNPATIHSVLDFSAEMRLPVRAVTCTRSIVVFSPRTKKAVATATVAGAQAVISAAVWRAPAGVSVSLSQPPRMPVVIRDVEPHPLLALKPLDLSGLLSSFNHKGIHQHVRGGDAQRDRKSTRLNSSHSQISYAVFCLKKKKKKK